MGSGREVTPTCACNNGGCAFGPHSIERRIPYPVTQQTQHASQTECSRSAVIARTRWTRDQRSREWRAVRQVMLRARTRHSTAASLVGLVGQNHESSHRTFSLTFEVLSKTSWITPELGHVCLQQARIYIPPSDNSVAPILLHSRYADLAVAFMAANHA